MLNVNELGYLNNYDQTKLKVFIQKGYMEYKCDSFCNIPVQFGCCFMYNFIKNRQ